MKKSKCKYCNITFDISDKPKGWMANHTRWCEKNPNRPKKKKKICPTCNKEFIGRNKFCSKKCIVVNDKTKEKISNSMKKYLKENPDKHTWKNNDKFKSIPCEKVKQYLKNKNINFIEEFSPIEDRFFSIDIAFPDKKIGIEINGNQHYNNDGTLSDYYQKRHNIITNAGWKLFEIHYTTAFTLDLLNDFIILEKNIDYTKYIKEIKQKKFEKESNKKNIKIEKRIKKEKLYIETQKIIQKLLNSNIDFSKFGWSGKASLLIGCKPQKVNKWMKKNMLNFYINNCFKRKNNRCRLFLNQPSKLLT